MSAMTDTFEPEQPVGVACGEGCPETKSGLHGDIKHNGRCQYCCQWIVRSYIRSVEQLLTSADTGRLRGR